MPIKGTKSSQYGEWCGAGGEVALLRPDRVAATIDVGLRWGWPRLPAHPVVLCAVFTAGPEWLLEPLTLPRESGIGLVRDGKWTKLYVVPALDAPDLASDLRRLLEGVREVLIASMPSNG